MLCDLCSDPFGLGWGHNIESKNFMGIKMDFFFFYRNNWTTALPWWASWVMWLMGLLVCVGFFVCVWWGGVINWGCSCWKKMEMFHRKSFLTLIFKEISLPLVTNIHIRYPYLFSDAKSWSLYVAYTNCC